MRLFRKLIDLFYSSLFYLRIKLRPGCNILGFPKIRGWVNLYGDGRIFIGKNFKVNSGKKFNPIGGDCFACLVANKGATLKIGNNVGISNSTIFCAHLVDIHNNVKIGGSVKIYDTDFHSLDFRDRRDSTLDKLTARKKPIVIDDDVFIGAHTIILKGVNIGKSAIIGSGSILRSDVKDGLIFYN